MTPEKNKQLENIIPLTEGVTAQMQETLLVVKGQKGEVKRDFRNPIVKLSVENNEIKLISKRGTARERKMMKTTVAHVRNMIKGSKEGHEYRLKMCSGHFPMNTTVTGTELIIKNFLGEKHPRKMIIKPGVKVKIEGQEVVVEGINKEEVGQCAANIEKLTRVNNRDRRIFQDGIYITSKDGKKIE